jgi:hypothetical protein
MSDVAEKPVPLAPPIGTAKAVRAYKKTLELERDGLRTGAAELARLAALGDAEAKVALAAIPARHAALTLEIDLNGEACELQHKLDADAEAAWRASLQSMDPEDLIAGINKDECCRRCQPGISGGCVLSGAAPYAGSTCFHPTRFGTFHQFNIDDSGRKVFPFRNHPRAAKVFNAALDKLKVRGKFAND